MTELFTRHSYLESVPFGLRVRRFSGTDHLKIEFDDGTEDFFLDPDEAKSLHAMLGDLLGAEPERPAQPTPPEPLKPIYSWKEPRCDGDFFAATRTDSFRSLPPGSHYARAYPSGEVRIYRKGAYDVNIHAKDYDDAIAKLRQLTQ